MDILTTKLKSIKRNLQPGKIWKKVFRKTYIQRFVIEKLIQDNQLQKSLTGLNQPIRDLQTGSTTYSLMTEIMSGGKKKAGDPYNLYDTGEFYKSMVFLLGNNFFEIDADPIKDNDNLFTKYGEQIIWLSENSKEKLRLRLRIEYETELRKVFYND
tara:strand:+ start:3711 stop:4178 length:468 start_codon:yes stop_codon:yes gene_type:complete